MSARAALTKSSRNVFADLGFPESEAQNLALRSDLMIRIEKLVQDSGMTQQQAAKTLCVTQPRLSALLTGKIADFSLDPLVNMLAHAGMQVKMTVKKAA
jgi:predicted XRE-type DNA-binding protein